MYSSNMSPCQQIVLYSCIVCISFPFITPSVLSTKFNITLTTPGNTSVPIDLPYKSVHVKYTVPNDKGQWTIVGVEPLIQTHQKIIEQLTVHLCDSSIDNSIWYNDEAICNGAQSMLIYEWTPYSSSSSFRIPDDYGFEFKKSTSVVLTVIYKKQKRVHKEQSGIILFLSNQPPRFQMGTMLVGNKQKGTHFSCRSSNFPRLLYGIKKLDSNRDKIWWRIHIIRVRQFGRKLVESVFDSKTISNKTQTHIEIVSPDLFLMKGDYLVIECENTPHVNCYFLLYYTYKSKLIKNDNVCQNDSFANLLKLIPSREILSINQTVTNSLNVDGSTIFLLLCVLLLIIWISIIVGCIIMRRVRGLVNFRTETPSPFSTEKNKTLTGRIRAPHDHFHRAGETDNIMQIDADQGGFTG